MIKLKNDQMGFLTSFNIFQPGFRHHSETFIAYHRNKPTKTNIQMTGTAHKTLKKSITAGRCSNCKISETVAFHQ